MSEYLLKVRDFTVRLGSLSAPVLERVSFNVAPGETLGIVGESGAGKTTLARALIGLLPAAWKQSGSVQFQGTELVGADERIFRQFRGVRLALISQEPELALNPVLTVGRQVAEVVRAHTRLRGRQLAEEAVALLAEVGLADRNTYAAYPHELSGGQRQRVVIAQALAAKPALLIADEPMSALDTVTQAEIISLLKRLKERRRLSLIFITHNVDLVYGLTTRVEVMRAGRMIGGDVSGTAFRPSPSDPSSVVLQTNSAASEQWIGDAAGVEWLRIEHLSKSYTRRGPLSMATCKIAALDDLSLELRLGSTLAIVGKSGSGKSTLGRCVALLETPDSGTIRLRGANLLTLSKAERKRTRPKIQLMFQQSATALNPLLAAADAVAEPLLIQKIGNRKERREKALFLMEKVGLPKNCVERQSLELSGGQRQRVALARALILEPSILILDEAFASLDQSTQAQLASVLLELQAVFSFSYIFISHDLRMAARMADQIAVMQEGRIVETGRAEALLQRPQCDTTRELIAATPQCLPAGRSESDK